MSNKWIIRGLLIAALALGAFYAYDNFVSPYRSTPDVVGSMLTDDDVIVSTTPRLTFRPADQEPTVGVIFYTGARVDPDAYAPIARQVADEGYFVVVVKHPFNFAVLGVSAASDVLVEYPEISSWIMAGHSMGGAMAAEFAERNQRISGLILLASYPDASSNLAFRNLNTLVVYGSEDGLVSPAEIEQNSADVLPKTTELMLIPGGNHAQFGNYGPQIGDGLASITRNDQQAACIKAILGFLRQYRS